MDDFIYKKGFLFNLLYNKYINVCNVTMFFHSLVTPILSIESFVTFMLLLVQNFNTINYIIIKMFIATTTGHGGNTYLYI